MASATFQYGALSTALQNYVSATEDNHYQNLFEPGNGFLKCEGKNKTWAVTQKKPEDMVAALEAVREGLQGMKAGDIPNALHLIQRVNQVYCEALYPGRAAALPRKDIIGFNSRCKDVTKVFSNFFSTLVIFRDPISKEDLIFPSSEAVYQLYKRVVLEPQAQPDFRHVPMSPLKLSRANSGSSVSSEPASRESSAHSTPEKGISRQDLDQLRPHRGPVKARRLVFGDDESAGATGPAPAPAMVSLLDARGPVSFFEASDIKEAEEAAEVTAAQFTRESSPLRAKKAGNSPLLKGKKPALTNEMAQKKYQLMNAIVQAKLKANPFIVSKLAESGDTLLVEDTGINSFWGGVPALSLRGQKLPVTKNSQNVLGTILMVARANI